MTRLIDYRILAAMMTLLLGGAVSSAQGQISVGLRGGYNLDAFNDDGVEEGAFIVGGEGRLGLRGLPIVLNPGVDFYMNGIDNTDVMQVDANVLYLIGADNVVFTPYIGAGLAMTRVSFDSGSDVIDDLLGDLSDETDWGVNVLGGATFGFGSIRPYAQARMTFGDHLAFLNEDGEGGVGYALMGGLLLTIGR